ncbi:MAG: hypothetical protein QXJ17_01810 [Nitrososphaeria archaeon]
MTDGNKLFWLRVGFALFGGLFSGVMNFSNGTAIYGVGLISLLYVLSYLIGKNVILANKNVERNTLIFSGIGTYIMLSLFTWILYYTLHLSGFI